MAKQELAKTDNPVIASLQTLDRIAGENAQLIAVGATTTLAQAYSYAMAVESVMAALTPDVMAKVFFPLKNKGRLGWRTDKEYTAEQLRDVWCDALLRGMLPVNDEVCIIGGNAYPEKNFFKRKLGAFPGLTDLKLQPSKVELKPVGATCEMTLTCKIGGKQYTLERKGESAIPIRLNAGQGADAAIGKAERKIMAQFYGQITGSDSGDDDTVDTVDVAQTNGKVVEATATIIDERKPASGTEAVKAAVKEARAKKGETTTTPAASGSGGNEVPWGDDEKKEEAPVEKPVETKQEAPPGPGKKRTVGKGTVAVEPVAEVAPAAAPKEEPKKEESEDQSTGEIETATAKIAGATGIREGEIITKYKIVDEHNDVYYLKPEQKDIAIEVKKNFLGKEASALISFVSDAKGDKWMCGVESAPAAKPAEDDDGLPNE